MSNTTIQENIDEQAIDVVLRPKQWEDYIGQEQVKKNLRVIIDAAKMRNEVVDHLLLYGQAGLGKTTLARLIAKELGGTIKVTSGAAIEKVGDLAAILSNLQEGEILFIDEIHRLNKTIEEVLYPALEDFLLDIILVKGPAARTIRMTLKRFSLIRLITKLSLISVPLRDRFGPTYPLNFYSPEDIEKIIQRNSHI